MSNKYISVNIIEATPMTRKEYHDYCKHNLSEDEKLLADEDGYLVEFTNNSKDNDQINPSYWSASDAFDKSYRNTDGMTFGLAVESMKLGYKVCRAGWNGKGMWVIFVPGRIVENLEPNSFYEKSGFTAPVEINGHFDMKAADGSMVVGWLASQTDLAADDWMIVD